MGRRLKDPYFTPFSTGRKHEPNREGRKMKIEEMKDSKMCALIAAQPYIRAVQIADAMEMGIEEVEDELRPHVNRGHMVTKDVLAPNGRSVAGYAFSNEFRKNEVYAAIMAQSQPQATALSMSAGSTAAAQLSTTVAAQNVERTVDRAPIATGALPPDQAARPLSRATVVVDFIRANGSATQEQVRDLLKLKPKEQPTSVLSSAVKTRRLVKQGNLWTLGTNVSEMRSAPAAKSPAKALIPAPAGFRCGCWSDGDVELQRGGQQLAVLTMDECRVIARMVEAVPA
jgi:hypothetical protein